MTYQNLQDMLNGDAAGEYIVIPRVTLGTILDLLYESVGDQGPMALRLLETLMIEMENKIIPYNRFGNTEFTVIITGEVNNNGTAKMINLIKEIRRNSGLGLNESKVITDGIKLGKRYTYQRTNDKHKVFEAVTQLREFGYNYVVYKDNNVIFDSKDSDDGIMPPSLLDPILKT